MRDRQRERQTEKETETDRDIQTNRQTERETDREIETERDRDRERQRQRDIHGRMEKVGGGAVLNFCIHGTPARDYDGVGGGGGVCVWRRGGGQLREPKPPD